MGADREAGSETERLDGRLPQPRLLVQLCRDARPREPRSAGARLRTRGEVPKRHHERLEVGLLQLDVVELDIVELDGGDMELVQLDCSRELGLVGLDVVGLDLFGLDVVRLDEFAGRIRSLGVR